MNHYDLSTRHASTLAAVTSTFGTVGAILVPVATGELTFSQVNHAGSFQRGPYIRLAFHVNLF